MNSTTKHKNDLLARKAELQERLVHLEDVLDDPKSRSFSEQATESEFDEVYEAQGSAGESEISMITAALKRIENGVYGKCLSCGGAISEARLVAVPYAINCRNCME